MASVKILRKRIASVKNTRQITRAMKLVSAAKLRRAQDAITMSRPFAQQLHQVMGRLAVRTKEELHPLLRRREEKNIRIVVLTSDRGLCGSFNASTIRRTLNLVEELRKNEAHIRVDFIGRKGRDLLKIKLPADVERGQSWEGIFQKAVTFTVAQSIATSFVESYTSQECDAVYFIYNEFRSAISQTVVAEKLLPVPEAQANADEVVIDYVYEPGKEDILKTVIPLYFSTQVYRALLDSVSSEHGARMTAMDNATKNAEEMIRKLTLKHNRLRQAGITKELMEIVSGAEAQGA